MEFGGRRALQAFSAATRTPEYRSDDILDRTEASGERGRMPSACRSLHLDTEKNYRRLSNGNDKRTCGIGDRTLRYKLYR